MQPQRGRVASSAGFGRGRRGLQARPGRPGARPGLAGSGERGLARRVWTTRRGLAWRAWPGLTGTGERGLAGLARRVGRTRRGLAGRAWPGLAGTGERGLAGPLVRRVGRTWRGLAGRAWPGLAGPGERGLVWRARASAAWRARPGERGLADPARGLADPARSGGPGLESAVWRTRRGLAGLGERGLVWRARPGDRGLAGLARAAWFGGPGLESAAWRTRRVLVWWGPASAVWSGGPGLESVVWRARRAVWRTRRGLAGPASAAQPIWRRPRELAVGLACWPPPRSPRPALVRGGRPGWPVAAVRCRGSLWPLPGCPGWQPVSAAWRRIGQRRKARKTGRRDPDGPGDEGCRCPVPRRQSAAGSLSA